MRTIAEWKALLRGMNISKERLQQRLNDEHESIEFLESIYVTGGKNSCYSKEFKDAAYNERQALCQLTSAIHSLLREMK